MIIHNNNNMTLSKIDVLFIVILHIVIVLCEDLDKNNHGILSLPSDVKILKTKYKNLANENALLRNQYNSLVLETRNLRNNYGSLTKQYENMMKTIIEQDKQIQLLHDKVKDTYIMHHQVAINDTSDLETRVTDLEGDVVILRLEVEQLEDEVDDVEDNLNTDINFIRTDIQTIQVDIQGLEADVEENEGATTDLEDTVDVQQITIQNIENNNNEQNILLEELNNELNQTNNKIDNLESGGNSAAASTLLFVSFNEFEISIPDREIIEFDDITIDEGNNYNNETGGYTAPHNGTYVFTVQKTGKNNSGEFYINVDYAYYARNNLYTYNSDSDPTATSTITMKLKKGQVVQVRNYGSTIIYGKGSLGYYSWFTGYMLYPEL